MAIMPQASQAIQRLRADGIIPKGCYRFELIADAHRPVTMRFEVFASEEQLRAIADAIAKNPAEASRMAREIAFKGNIAGPSIVSVSVK